MFPSLSPSFELLARAQAEPPSPCAPNTFWERPPRRHRPHVRLALFDPAEGIHTVGRLVLFRVVNRPATLSHAVEQIETFRAGLPTRKHYPRLVVLVLPFGTSLDPYVEELVDLSERNICVAVDGSVVLTEMLARARVAARAGQ